MDKPMEQTIEKINMVDDIVDNSMNIINNSIDNALISDSMESNTNIDTNTDIEYENIDSEQMEPEFTYLEENNELQTLFTFCVPESTEEIRVNILFYKLNWECSIASYKGEYDDVVFENVPFIMFGVLKKDVYELPYFTYSCVSAKTDEDIETNFRNECILNAIRISGKDDADHNLDAYKGFVMHENEIYVVIDMNLLVGASSSSRNSMTDGSLPNSPIINTKLTSITQEHSMMNGGNEELVLEWGLVDELIFEKKMNGLGISDKIGVFMKKHSFFWQLEYKGNLLPFPFVIYGLKKENDNYVVETVREKNTEESEEQDQQDQHEQIEHDVFGLWYMFLVWDNETEVPTNAKKYACFVTSPNFYDEMDDMTIDVDSPSQEEKKNDEEDAVMNIGEELLATSCIYFKHGGVYTWGIKYEEQFCEI